MSVELTKQQAPGATGRPWRKAISTSVLTAPLADPTPSATKELTLDGARNCVMDIEGHTVARLMFGGVGAENTILNWQAILWSRTSNPLNIDAWIPRVIGNGTATLGTDVYAVAGLGTTTNKFADTITDTVLHSKIYTPVDNTRAVVELPMFNAQRLEIQTDLPAGTPVTSVDVFVQLGEGSMLSAADNMGNVGLVNAAEVEINPATSDLQTTLNTLVGKLYPTASVANADDTAGNGAWAEITLAANTISVDVSAAGSCRLATPTTTPSGAIGCIYAANITYRIPTPTGKLWAYGIGAAHAVYTTSYTRA